MHRAGSYGCYYLELKSLMRLSTEFVRIVEAKEVPDNGEDLLVAQTAFLQVADGVLQQFFKKFLGDGGLFCHNPLFTNGYTIGR